MSRCLSGVGHVRAGKEMELARSECLKEMGRVLSSRLIHRWSECWVYCDGLGGEWVLAVL